MPIRSVDPISNIPTDTKRSFSMPECPCVLCARTPAELNLFGRPLCEECAHNIVSDAAWNTRKAREADRARREPLPLVERDGERGVMVGERFVPCIA